LVKVETILLKITTADVPNADIDSGAVYLGIGGREFRRESDIESGDREDDLNVEPNGPIYWTKIPIQLLFLPMTLQR
jgi:hypothetical protein